MFSQTSIEQDLLVRLMCPLCFDDSSYWPRSTIMGIEHMLYTIMQSLVTALNSSFEDTNRTIILPTDRRIIRYTSRLAKALLSTLD